ncbi:hypothetical protein MTO96_033271 [Rhipicephalus appendiculatus]
METSRRNQQQLEQQAISTIGNWLQQKAMEASQTGPVSPTPVVSSAAATDDFTDVPVSTTTDVEEMDVTVASRKRGRRRHIGRAMMACSSRA